MSYWFGSSLERFANVAFTWGHVIFVIFTLCMVGLTLFAAIYLFIFESSFITLERLDLF